MSDIGQNLSRAYDVGRNVASLFQHRLQSAQSRYSDRVQGLVSKDSQLSKPLTRMPWEWAQDWGQYLVDAATKQPLTDARAGWPVSQIVAGLMFAVGQLVPAP